MIVEDFRLISPGVFQLLKSMCDLTNTTVYNALSQFGKTEFVSAQLLKRDLFLIQMDQTIEQFQSSLPNNFLHLWELTRNVTYMNQFITGTYSNILLYSPLNNIHTSPLTMTIAYPMGAELDGVPTICSCANSMSCGRPAKILPNISEPCKFYSIPNFYNRCFPVESLMQSSLECFYNNHPCLDVLTNITNEALFTNMTRLDAAKSSRFSPHTTIGDLLEQLFIDPWSSSNASYSTYFNNCQPVLCSYTVTKRRSRLEIITIITGLIGGLSTVLKLLSPYIISACIYFLRRHWRLARNSTTQHGELCRRLIG
ncbi:unnamed protein product [Adineta steineri]|uniref:Uncharacterized protein n=1 Tax=Adineta steineri TaxID=433720 RepID=A0A820IMH5_9BILA|nr:unnamed protein product [Adineta steineri]